MGHNSGHAHVELMLEEIPYLGPDGLPYLHSTKHIQRQTRRNALRASIPLASPSTSHMQPTRKQSITPPLHAHVRSCIHVFHTAATTRLEALLPCRLRRAWRCRHPRSVLLRQIPPSIKTLVDMASPLASAGCSLSSTIPAPAPAPRTAVIHGDPVPDVEQSLSVGGFHRIAWLRTMVVEVLRINTAAGIRLDARQGRSKKIRGKGRSVRFLV